MRLMKRVILVVILFLSLSCMKKRCYECVDDNGNSTAQGCDKTVEEIEMLENNNGWDCEILPD